jgi:hypothetical protein
MATSDIEIAISVESLADHFLISPNALHRGEGEYAGLTLHERGMLAALLTLHPGAGRQWNTSRAGINDLAPELGRDKITSILNGLHARGYLYKRRVNMGAGRFRWEWRVFMKARPEGFDPFAASTPTIDGEHVNGDEQPKPDVSAGHTIDGSSGPNRTSPKEGRSSRSTSPLPPAPTAPAIEAGAVPGEETPTDEDTAIQAAVRAAIAHQPTWRPAAVRAAIHQAIAEGLPAPVAHRVIVELAEGNTWGPTTAGPQRIIARGPWWTPGAVFVPAPPKDTKAECGRHPGQPARSCACCASERLEATPAKATPPPVAGVPDEARDLFSRIPALRRPRPAQRRTAPAES